MTTLVLSEVFPPKIGGSGRWLWEIYRRLPRQDYTIVAGEDPRQTELDRGTDVRIARLPLTFPDTSIASWRGARDYWRATRAVSRLARRHKIKRVHAGRCLPEGWIALLLKRLYGLPYLCFVHGEEVKLAAFEGGVGTMSSRQLRWMTGMVLRGAQSVVVNSRETLRILTEEWGLPSARVRLLHPGVDIHHFVPAASDERPRARLGWSGRRVVLTVGRLQKRKGHDMLIQALPTILQTVPDVLYAIVGDGEERSVLEQLAAQHGVRDSVQLLGELDDASLLSCYQQCDLFALPNRQIGTDVEGFGIVLLEAQACGKPVLAGASGGTAETMAHGETGILLRCDTPDELAASLAVLLADRERRARMGAAARRWTVERFDADVKAREAQRLFDAAFTPCGTR